jgi:F-type H+-transporting ATPase subunit b
MNKSTATASADFLVSRESFSMLRQTKSSFSITVLACLLAWFAAGGRLMAGEMQKHGPTFVEPVERTKAPAGVETEMAKEEHVPAEPKAKINPLEVKPALAVWSLVVFVSLLFVLGRFAWKPLLAALHSREQHLEHVLLETERARNESEANLAEHRRLIARAGDEVRSILDKARQEAQATAEALIKAAQGEAELAKQRAQRDIAQARDQALAEIWEKTADMAVSVAGRVLSKELNDTDHRRLLDAAIKELPAKAGANGHGGKRS